ncbi:MAG TPA: DUF6789 family protein [Bacillota bacterium]|nr:DUF6789 family protein [Bacillota bacterium]
MKQDLVIMGAIGGASGAVAQIIYGSLGKMLHLTDRTFNDFAKILIMGRNFSGPLAFIAGIVSHLSFNAMFGVLFAFLIWKVNANYYYLKGLGMGMILWIFLGVTGTAMHLPKFTVIPPNAALFTYGGALLWGLVTAFVYRLLNSTSEKKEF